MVNYNFDENRNAIKKKQLHIISVLLNRRPKADFRSNMDNRY